MVGSIVNHLLLNRFKDLLKEFYHEPKEEEIIGTFLSLASETDIEIEPSTRPATTQATKDRKKKKGVSSVRPRDIHPKKKRENSTIVFD